MNAPRPRTVGILAEFESPATLLQAAAKVRDAGYTKFDCHSPFPIHGMDQAMGLRRSPIGYIVGVVAILALGGAATMMWWMTTIDYPLVISGKPYFSYQAYVPIAFALTILSSAAAALIGMLILNRLPQLFHPLFESSRFSKFSDDSFFVSIETADPKFDQEKTKSFLGSLGATYVEVVVLK